MKSVAVGVFLGALLSAPTLVVAQGYTPTTVVRTIPGMQCMALADEYGPQGAYAPPAPEYAGSNAGAPRIGIGAGTILVPDPLKPVNGRSEVLRPNGQKAWIDVSLLTRWHALSSPSATCQPVLLSNGRYGFKTSG